MQREQAFKLIHSLSDVFTTKPGRTHLTECCIQIIPDASIQRGSFQIPEWMQEAVKRELKSVLELGVLEEPHSEWHSPVFLVPKPDNRVCFMFIINAILRFNANPMPRVDEILERVGPAS